jgi:hypothetical protein
MAEQRSRRGDQSGSTRRRFLGQLGRGAVAAGVGAKLWDEGRPAAADGPGKKVGYRVLGKTGLKVSEVGFGGHSWSYKQLPDGSGGLRKVSVDEAVEMIRIGMGLGVNFLDSCTPLEESSTPLTR